MVQETTNQHAPPTRRNFLATAGVAAMAPVMVAQNRRRVALIGTGHRGLTAWAQPILADFSDVVEIAGLCDINRKRVEAARNFLGPVVASVPTFVDFDQMVTSTKPDTVIVTTPDATHWRYIVHGMELGCHVITEKGLCTDEEQCQAILETQKRLSAHVSVAHNARHSPAAKKVRQLLMEGAVGEVTSVVYHEYLDTSHGASYFRRWHRLKEMNGTLLVTKACHHFDNVNWWLQQQPVEVTGLGRLTFYGKNNSYRSTHCRGCPYQKQCAFYWDISKDEFSCKLFVECESEDGYFRDGCVWREDANIYDSSAVIVKYANGAELTHTCETFQPYEGAAITFNGKKGRLDCTDYAGGGFRNREIRLTRLFRKSEVIPVDSRESAGGHRNADASVRDLLFRNQPADDPLKLRASLREGALAALVGIAAYRSIERGGRTVKIKELSPMV
jgi:predicted dehydrogenase